MLVAIPLSIGLHGYKKNKNASCIDQVHSNLDTGSIDNHVVLADVSDHFGTLSKIEGITREIEKQKCFL